MNEISNDLKALAEMELPPKNDKVGRHVVKVTILCFAITIFASLLTVTYALVASLSREKSLEQEISCVRQSAVLVDRRLGEGISVVIDNNSVVLYALEGVALDNPAQLDEALAEVEVRLQAGEVAKSNLDSAIEAREAALAEC